MDPEWQIQTWKGNRISLVLLPLMQPFPSLDIPPPRPIPDPIFLLPILPPSFPSPPPHTDLHAGAFLGLLALANVVLPLATDIKDAVLLECVPMVQDAH